MSTIKPETDRCLMESRFRSSSKSILGIDAANPIRIIVHQIHPWKTIMVIFKEIIQLKIRWKQGFPANKSHPGIVDQRILGQELSRQFAQLQKLKLI